MKCWNVIFFLELWVKVRENWRQNEHWYLALDTKADNRFIALQQEKG
jgi:GTPase Era involved in 16S rRNA processing